MTVLKEIVVISGRSGAGKSTASRALEDLGYFVVDNLPPQLLDGLLTIADQAQGKIHKIAVTVDVREIEFLQLMPKKWHELDDKYNKKLLFLDASEEQLIHRYQETKRRHPLDDGCGIREALHKEHGMLAPIKALATKEIFTDKLNAHELRNVIKREVMSEGEQTLNVKLLSFGFKHGVPSELDLCFDVRFLTNPYYIQALRTQTGLDKEVFDYVMALSNATTFLDKVIALFEFLYPLYQEEGKSSLTIALGCTGGQHRSVALVQALGMRLKESVTGLRIEHRDLY